MFYYDGNILRIMNYLRINSLDESKIELSYQNEMTLVVTGNDLKIIYLEPSELHLTGNIITINKIAKNEKA
jgi:hypothetical protein